MMLNSLSPNVVDSVYCTVPGVLPQLVSGRTVALADQEYPGLKKMTSGGFGTIYTCKRCKETKVLKVYTHVPSAYIQCTCTCIIIQSVMAGGTLQLVYVC